jgi:hypothetical protein
MSSSDNKYKWSTCVKCKGDRKHEVMADHRVTDTSDEYHSLSMHQILSCRGCGQVSFRKELHDYEAGHPDPDKEGGWDYPIREEFYPKVGHVSDFLLGYWDVPKIVLTIYKQSVLAMEEGAGILAGLGLRGTIEAICNEREIKGTNLEKRISGLVAKGLVSKKDADRLHAIRFLGNDAAHEIKEPTASQLQVARRIVENILMTVYVLEVQVRDELEYIVSSFDELKPILDRCLKDCAANDVKTLAALIGQHRRRAGDSLPAIEVELKTAIASGNYSKLALDQVTQVGTPPKPVQTYRVV